MSEAKIQRIFKHYGEQSQLAKTQEELHELDEAIQTLIDLYKQVSFYRSEQDFLKDHIADEAADVSIMIDQLKYGLGIEARFEAWREYKIDRQLKRMETEQ